MPVRAAGVAAIPIAFLALLTLGSGDHVRAQGTCRPEVEPNDTELTATESSGPVCVSGVLLEGDQDLGIWEIPEDEAATLWSFSVDGLPGVLTALKVFEIASPPGVEPIQVRGAHILEVAREPVDGQAAFRDGVLLLPGRYLLGISRSTLPEGSDETDAVYRYDIVPGVPLPPAGDVEPNGTPEEAPQVVDAFELSGDLDASTDMYTWTVSDQTTRWDLELLVPLGMSAALDVLDGDGRTVTSVSDATSARLYDLSLAPGIYQVRAAPAADRPRTYVLRARPSEAAGDPEPNDESVTAVPVADGVLVRGRLARTGDRDRYRISVPPGDASLRDIRMIWRSGLERRLCLLDAADQPAVCRTGSDGIGLPALRLGPGEHVLEIQGAAEPTDAYALRVDVVGLAPDGFEAEPNDDVATATRLDPAIGVRGRGEPADTDVFRFSVEGEPQLWRVDVTGDDIERLEWIRPGGSVLEQGSISPDRSSATLSDLYLVPGEHWLRTRIDGIEYALQLTPLGPPDPEGEREPNGSRLLAEGYRIGERKVGRLPVSDDIDVYRFTLAAPGHVRFGVAPPGDATVELRLRHGDDTIAELHATEPGAAIEWDLWLQPGDHLLEVHPTSVSEGHYELTSVRLDPFQLAVDQEPNDGHAWARPVPASLSWDGVGAGRDDEDWYELPAMTTPGNLRIEVDDPAARVRLAAGRAQVALDREDGGAFVARAVPADTRLQLVVIGEGPYHVDVHGAAQVTARDPAPLALEMSWDVPADPVAAFWPERQSVTGDLRLTNTASETLDIELETATSHYLWSAELADTSASLAPGESIDIPARIDIEADAWADEDVLVAARAATADGATASATIELSATADGPPTLTSPSWTVPDRLLGGLNAAYAGFGALPGGEIDPDRELALFDGVTPDGGGFSQQVAAFPLELSVDLAGDVPVPVAGIILDPLARSGRLSETPEDFALLLSLDGVEWATALEGRVLALPIEQSFVLPEAVEARQARLRIGSTYADEPGYLALGEWKVIIPPGLRLGSEPMNLADPPLGGHIVRMVPFSGDQDLGRRMLDAERTRDSLAIDDERTVDIVIGFQDGRAARIQRLEWIDPDGSDPTSRLDEVDVWTSTQSSLGPWQSLGAWRLERATDGSVAMFAPGGPAWARYVRLTGVAPPETRQLELPATVQVIESDTDETYPSILGEWGAGSPRGPLEWSAPPRTMELDPGQDAADHPEDAAPLAPGTVVRERAQIEVDEDWYAIDVPAGQSGIEIALGGQPTVGVALSLLSADGVERPMAFVRQPDGTVRYQARAESGQRYWLHVRQPPFSAVFAYDTSGSMGPFLDIVLQGMRAFVSEVLPGREAVMILPFEDPPLLPDWEDDPYVLQDAANGAAPITSSSGAEAGLIDASALLSEREGARAILLVTDAVSSTYRLSREAWDALGTVRPIVFAVHIGAAETPVVSRQLMQDWAASGGGQYAYTATHGQMDRAFDRMATWLRRPAVYDLEYQAIDLAPGSLGIRAPEVDAPVALAPGAAVEIILDTSGSMLKKLGGERRIKIAKESLERLVGAAMVEQLPVALRTFGGNGGKATSVCQTRLAVPLRPLVRADMLARIRELQAVPRTKTPIGGALAAVGEDLRDVDGPRSVVLVTDGGETCGGDPAASIAELRAGGIDMTVNIVGFALEDGALKDQMIAWAAAGHGSYFDAADADELVTAMAAAVSAPFRVYGPDGEVYEGGTIGGGPIQIDPGTYRVEVLTDPVIAFEEVVVEGGEQVILELPQTG